MGYNKNRFDKSVKSRKNKNKGSKKLKSEKSDEEFHRKKVSKRELIEDITLAEIEEMEAEYV